MTIVLPPGYTPDPEASCGPADWPVDLVPDQLLGLDIRAACAVHDWEYDAGGDEEARNGVDWRFLAHMLALVAAAGGPYRGPRTIAAHAYYHAVRLLGARSYRYRLAFRVRQKRRQEVQAARAAMFDAVGLLR